MNANLFLLLLGLDLRSRPGRRHVSRWSPLSSKGAVNYARFELRSQITGKSCFRWEVHPLKQAKLEGL